MIWQDPVDYSHITYEYDHRCVNYYQVHNIDLGASHSVLSTSGLVTKVLAINV